MTTVLHTDCSARVVDSVSRRLSRAVVDELYKVEPSIQLTRRDLGAAEGLAWGERERDRSINTAVENIQHHFAKYRHFVENR